jgi:electron transport complex protein RnfG
MNPEEIKKLTAPPNSWNMMKAMGSVGILCSLLIVFTYETTLPIIKKNKAEMLEKAVFEVLPKSVRKSTFKINSENQLEPFKGEESGERLVYAGYDAENRLVGVAIEASGQGFQDVLRIIYGYSPDKQIVIGMKVLESKETPGLGDKIEKDPDFVANFEALDVKLTDNEESLKNIIGFVKKGEKEHPWQISGITGATISSKAISKIVSESTENWIPIVHNQQEKLQGYK